MATEAEPPSKFSSSEEDGGGGEEVDKGKLMVVTIEDDGEQQPPRKSEGPEAVRGGGKSKRPVVFTKDQLCELQRQLAVLSYIRARLPVPPVLLLHTRGYVHSSNSPLARLGPRSSNCYSKMEPEPGRCRRTDGKRWRCKNGVIPNTKYCERHIHRGRNRSRKLVEGAVYNPTISPPITSQPAQQASSCETPPLLQPLPPSNSTKKLENLCDVGSNLTSSMSLVQGTGKSAETKVTCTVNTTASEDVRPHSSDSTSHDTAGIMVGLGTNPTHNLVRAAIGCSKREIRTEKDDFNHTAKPVDAAYSSGIGKEHTIVTASSKVQSTSVASTPSDISGRKIMTKDEDFASSGNAASTIAISMVAKRDCGDTRSHGSDNSQSIGQDSATKRRIRIRVIDKIITSQGFIYSPKSVLQGANDHHPHLNPPIQGCSPLCFNKSDQEEQVWRCRRTDGRKWRCSRDVIPNEKYCAMHVHRGAKRQVQNSQPTDLPCSKRSRATHPHLHPSLPSKEKYTSLNPDLSIPAPEMSRPIKDDEPSTTGNSSDATIYSSDATIYSSDATISDDNTSYENLTFA